MLLVDDNCGADDDDHHENLVVNCARSVSPFESGNYNHIEAFVLLCMTL